MSQSITNEQRIHLEQRLAEITQEKLQAKRVELYGSAGRPQSPTWKMVFDAIKAGEIILKEDAEELTRPFLMPDDVMWPAMEQKAKDLEAYADMLNREAQDVLDRFILSNVSGAVEALKAFSDL
jgi:hypothetical protein